MKKMLTLVLVLAVASLASAAPTWTLTPPAGIVTDPVALTVSVTSNPGVPTYLLLAVQPTEGVLSDFGMAANAPASSAYFADVATNFPALGQGEIWAMAHFTTGTPEYLDGSWLNAKLTFAPSSTSATVSLYEFVEATSENTFLGSVTYTTIPEPITMSLLGLGGLFLRRKK